MFLPNYFRKLPLKLSIPNNNIIQTLKEYTFIKLRKAILQQNKVEIAEIILKLRKQRPNRLNNLLSS